MKIKKGDKVKVLSGKDRGKLGEIKLIDRKTNRVIVSGVNFVTKFEKKKNEQEKGGLIKVEGPMSVSKVQLIDPKTNKPTRIGVKVENGKRVRVTKRSQTVI
jgi:large subunit ribosomal protein L24